MKIFKQGNCGDLFSARAKVRYIPKIFEPK
jgi:hypothetical protein